MNQFIISVFTYGGEATVSLKKNNRVVTGGGKCGGFPLIILIKTILKFYSKKEKYGKKK